MRLGILILTLMVFGCSQTVEQYEFSGHKRVSYLDKNEKRPKFYYKSNSHVKRAPASIEEQAEEVEISTSLRADYFKALWNQKKDFEMILGYKSDNFCPQFHHQLLGMKKQNSNFYNIKEMTKKVNNHRNPVNYPVLALPYEDSDLYSYQQNNQKIDEDDMREAFNNFYQLTKKEVTALCETGVSEGYFMTKNLADYYVTDAGFKKSEGYIEAMLKTPFVANMYVLKSFKKSKIDLNNTPEVLQHLNAHWLVSYFDRVTTGHNQRITQNRQVEYE
jgi:hypothetical protein